MRWVRDKVSYPFLFPKTMPKSRFSIGCWLLSATLLALGCSAGTGTQTSTPTNLPPPNITSSTAQVDFGSKHQVIRGFGGSTAWMGSIGPGKLNVLFGTAPGQIGLSILRVRIDPGGSAGSGWITSNWTAELANAQTAQKANPNAIVIATPWTPPASMKSNNNVVAGTLNAGSYAAYAGYLESFVNYFSVSGTPLYAISIQNEPDANVTYESCSWTGTTLDAWVSSLTANGATNPITAKLMMPESESFATGLSDAALNDGNAVGNIGIVAGHIYGTAPTYYANAVSKGKEAWQTEHYLSPTGSQPTINDALAAAIGSALKKFAPRHATVVAHSLAEARVLAAERVMVGSTRRITWSRAK